MYLPVYDSVRTVGARQEYHIAYYAPFVVTGFVLNSTPGADTMASWLVPGALPCGPGPVQRCVAGIFPDGLVPVSMLAGDALVRLIG